ncbi:hypothetical protein AVEN_28047-1 [Araneus ventricosus]|uniref:Uncharacterized protein n=1 Tax=Araneus ventricosus TaxID=182803 RepID=A0A4Y2BHC4_ARAVE|nr:hypothetical protein AVEN_28047-1 [Araneus ventricosus]
MGLGTNPIRFPVKCLVFVLESTDFVQNVFLAYSTFLVEMDDRRLEGQEDKLYVVIAYAGDMQIFICNRDVFILRLSQKYRIPMQNIGFYDFELESPSSMIDLKDIRDGMILQMVNKLELPVTEEASGVAFERARALPFQEGANISGVSASHPKEEANIARYFVLPPNIVEASASSPMEEDRNPKEVGTLMPSTSSSSEETARFKKVKLSFKPGKHAGSNLTKIRVKKIVFF